MFLLGISASQDTQKKYQTDFIQMLGDVFESVDLKYKLHGREQDRVGKRPLSRGWHSAPG